MSKKKAGVSATFYGVGVPDKRFPKRCVACLKRIEKGEAWQGETNGEYRVVRHSRCVRIS